MTNSVYLLCYMYMFKHSQVALVVKNPPANPGDIRDSGSIPWRRQWQPTPVCLPGKSHGQRSLVGHSPWGRTESNTTERLTLLLLLLGRLSHVRLCATPSTAAHQASPSLGFSRQLTLLRCKSFPVPIVVHPSELTPCRNSHWSAFCHCGLVCSFSRVLYECTFLCLVSFTQNWDLDFNACFILLLKNTIPVDNWLFHLVVDCAQGIEQGSWCPSNRPSAALLICNSFLICF